MSAARKFLALSAHEKWLLAEVLLTVISVRLALTLLPYRAWNALAARFTRPHSGRQFRDVQQLGRAVQAASRRVQGASCLTQALSMQILLARRGEATTLRLGVARDGAAMIAHAWLEKDQVVIFGDSQPQRFTPLQPVKSRSR